MTDRSVEVFTERKGRRNTFDETIGTMSQQEADAVAITGGTAQDVTNPSIEIGVVAAGSVAGDATAVTKQTVVVATAALNTGVIIPDAAAGKEMVVFNQGANALDVYPATGDQINGAAVLIVAIGGSVVLKAVDATDWYSVG